MNKIDILIEALEYMGEYWYMEFTPDEAFNLLNKSLTIEPEEHQVVTILELLAKNQNPFENTTPCLVFKKCIKELKIELKRVYKEKDTAENDGFESNTY